MIDLPESVLRELLDSNIARGKVLLTRVIVSQGQRFKRLILLNNDFSEDDIYYLLTTSKVDFYNKYRNLDPVKGNFIYCKKGSTPINQDEPMVIDCREAHIIKKGKLLQNYKNKMLKFLGDTPEDIMTEIDTIINFSKLIPKKIKTHIV